MTAAVGRRRLTPAQWAKLRRGLIFISPWILGVLAFTVFPLIYSVVISFTRYTGTTSPTWLGLENYRRLFSDPLAGKAAGNTAFYTVLAVPIGLVVALILALAMSRKVREVAVYRTALYLPSLAPAFAFSFIFIVLVNPGYGVLTQVLSAFGVSPRNYLGGATSAKLVIVTMAQFAAGNAALIFLAGLNNIPETLYDAARVDGAGALRRLATITVPLLSPVILFNAISGVNGALQIFTPSYIMTNGGPDNGTLFYMYYLYSNAFSYAQLGYASALAVVLFVVGVVLAAVIFGLSRRYVHYSVEV